MEIEHTTFGGE